jgi:hypothetical protein
VVKTGIDCHEECILKRVGPEVDIIFRGKQTNSHVKHHSTQTVNEHRLKCVEFGNFELVKHQLLYFLMYTEMKEFPTTLSRARNIPNQYVKSKKG